MGMRITEAELHGLFPELSEISDPPLRAAVTAIWQEIAAECAWDRLDDIPKNLDAEKHRRLTDHIRIVTRMALRLAETAQSESGTAYNRDHLIAMCLLHDVSKPVECEPDPTGADPTGAAPGGPVRAARKSKLGKLVQHAVYATHKCFAHNLPVEIAHVVNTHTHQSGVASATVEGAYLFYADYCDSDVALIPSGGRTFLSRWELR